jgi:hypothetical protein
MEDGRGAEIIGGKSGGSQCYFGNKIRAPKVISEFD